MTDFIIAKGDLLPEIYATLEDDDGDPADLTDCTVVFLMAEDTTTLATPVVNSSATIVDAVTGQVKYSWQSGDTDEVGTYVARWRVTNTGSGKTETFPNINFNTIVVTDNF